MKRLVTGSTGQYRTGPAGGHRHPAGDATLVAEASVTSRGSRRDAGRGSDDPRASAAPRPRRRARAHRRGMAEERGLWAFWMYGWTGLLFNKVVDWFGRRRVRRSAQRVRDRRRKRP